jgi:hypothetical protein
MCNPGGSLLHVTAALERIVQKWAVLEEYFLVKAPQLAAKQSKQAEKYLRENSWYKRICQKLRSATMLSEIHFIINVGKHLDKFLLFFQIEGPLIHLLYDELNSTLRSIMLCFLKQDVVGEKRGNELISIDLNKTENYLNVKQMDVGQKTRKAMEKLTVDQQKHQLLGMGRFLIITSEYLKDHFPVNVTPLLKDLSYLHPLMKERKAGLNAIQRIATLFPPSDACTDRVLDEWKIYQSQDIPNEWYIKSETRKSITYHRIDYYWDKVLNSKTLSGGQKYPTLTSVIKSALCPVHGNAEVERSF